MQTDRRQFYEPKEIVTEVQHTVEQSRAVGQSMHYLGFVPDAGSTLHVKLGNEIEMLRPLGIRIAVLTNVSLIDRNDVRRDLAKADLAPRK
jgi:wyosine [tRNA(Phe)-imidazoG37] synthetase (radical SAM superfamily)